MHRFLIIWFLTYSFSVAADPHYVQALQPYWGDDNRFNEYLGGFDKPVNIDIGSYKGSLDPYSGTDWYIYIYIINEKSPKHFALDISCPDVGMQLMSVKDRDGKRRNVVVESVTSIDGGFWSDPVRNNPSAYIHGGHVIWPLDSTGGAQGMWIYSTSAPTDRTYRVVDTTGNTIQEESIKGPSCSSPGESRLVTMTEEERAVFDGVAPYVDLRATEFKVEWSMNEDGFFVYSYDIKSSNSNLGDIESINLDIKCEDTTMDSYGYTDHIGNLRSNTISKSHHQYGNNDSALIKDYVKQRGSKSITWRSVIKPGKKKEGLQVISTEPPVAREYTISPSFKKGYVIPQETPYSDYEVSGMIEGPGCPNIDVINSSSFLSPLTKEKQRQELRRIRQQQRLAQPVGPVIAGGIEDGNPDTQNPITSGGTE